MTAEKCIKIEWLSFWMTRHHQIWGLNFPPFSPINPPLAPSPSWGDSSASASASAYGHETQRYRRFKTGMGWGLDCEKCGRKKNIFFFIKKGFSPKILIGIIRGNLGLKWILPPYGNMKLIQANSMELQSQVCPPNSNGFQKSTQTLWWYLTVYLFYNNFQIFNLSFSILTSLCFRAKAKTQCDVGEKSRSHAKTSTKES